MHEINVSKNEDKREREKKRAFGVILFIKKLKFVVGVTMQVENYIKLNIMRDNIRNLAKS